MANEYNVGDRVLVEDILYGNCTRYIGLVIHKTPTGLVDVKIGNVKSRFRKDGSKIGRYEMGHSTKISPIMDEIIKDIERERKRDKMIKWAKSFDWSMVSDEGLLKVMEITEKYRVK